MVLGVNVGQHHMNGMHEAVGRCADVRAYTLLLCLYTYLHHLETCLFNKNFDKTKWTGRNVSAFIL
jgi:hypothetical protein